MGDPRQLKIENVFAAALLARENSARGTIETADLLGLCDGDDVVHREVESLLRHLDAKTFLNPEELHGKSGPGSAFGDDALLRDWGGEAIGQRIDGFTIIGRLGEGGMGVVYVAEQENPRRTVALKLMRRGVATSATLRRFEREV